MLRFPNSSLF